MENNNNMNKNGYQQPNQPQYGYQQPNQPQYGYQQPYQPQYGYQQPNQPQYGYQQPNQPQYGYQQSNQMRYVDQPYQQMRYADQYGSQPVNQPQNDKPGNSGGPKKKKTGLIIAIIAVFVVLLIGAGATAVYFHMTEKKNEEAASAAASEFIKAYGSHDLNSIQGYFPDKIKKADEIVEFTDETRYDGMKYFDYTIKDVKVTDAEKYSVETVANDVKKAYNKRLDVKSSYCVSIKYTEIYGKDGETVENTLTDKVICGKIDEKWYVLDPALISKKNQIVADLDKEADDVQSKDAVEKLMSCVTESDMEGINASFASTIRDLSSTKESEEALTESFGKLDEFGIKFTVGEFHISEPKDYDVNEAKASVKNKYGIEPDFEKCRKFTADYSVTIEADGESTSKDVTEEFICGKEDSKWYIYNSDIIAAHNNLFADIIDEKETAIDEEEVRETINAYVESLALLDIETMKSYMPDAVLNDEDIASTIGELESQKVELDSYGVVLSLDSIEIGTITKENTGALMIEIMIGYEVAVLNIEKAYSTTVTFSRSASLNGRTESDEITSDMICARIDGKWYILHAEIADEE